MKRIVLVYFIIANALTVPIMAATFKVSDIATKGPITAGTLTTPGTARFKAAETINYHAHYGFLDDSNMDYTGNVEPIVGHASYDANVIISGSKSFDHHYDYQAYPHYNATGTLGKMSGFWMLPDITAGTISELSEFKAGNPLGSGIITSLYGLYIESMTRGANNWAVYTAGTTPSAFGGKIFLGDPVNGASVQYEPTSGNTLITARDLYATAFKNNTYPDRTWLVDTRQGVIQHKNLTAVETQIGYAAGDTWFGASSGTTGLGANFFLSGTTGAVKIGTSVEGVGSKLNIGGPNTTITSGTGVLNVTSTDSMGVNLGSQVTMGGSYTGTSPTTFAAISGRKENATAGDTSGYLSLSTNVNLTGVVERVRVTSTGNVILNNVPVYADNTAAASLATGTIYRTVTGQLMLKY